MPSDDDRYSEKRYTRVGEFIAVELDAPYDMGHTFTGRQRGDTGDFLVWPVKSNRVDDGFVVPRDAFLAAYDEVRETRRGKGSS